MNSQPETEGQLQIISSMEDRNRMPPLRGSPLREAMRDLVEQRAAPVRYSGSGGRYRLIDCSAGLGAVVATLKLLPPGR